MGGIDNKDPFPLVDRLINHYHLVITKKGDDDMPSKDELKTIMREVMQEMIDAEEGRLKQLDEDDPRQLKVPGTEKRETTIRDMIDSMTPRDIVNAAFNEAISNLLEELQPATADTGKIHSAMNDLENEIDNIIIDIMIKANQEKSRYRAIIDTLRVDMKEELSDAVDSLMDLIDRDLDSE